MTDDKPYFYTLNERVKNDFDKLYIIFMSDVHYGNMNFDEEFFDKVLDWLAKEENQNKKVITGGDLMECAILSAPGHYDQSLTTNDQFDYIYDKLKPLAERDQLIGMIRGNHEKRIMRKTSMDVTQKLAKWLDVEYFGAGVVINAKIGRYNKSRQQNYILYFTHGASGAWTLGGKLNAAKRLGNILNAELYCMGHVHSLMSIKRRYFEVINDRLVERPRHYVVSGSYLDYWEGYAQEKARGPGGAKGSPKIKLDPDTHRISVTT